ncbi:MAG: AAA family ATPase [Lawsonibacter sp.]
MESVKITSLELENVKRIRACTIQPTKKGLTVIGGRNNQGKTSILDAIAWTLGGDRYRPSQAVRDGSAISPRLKVKLSNGIVVERLGKNSDLKVTDPEGCRAGQQLLNCFIEQLALDLPQFMKAGSREKADTLLKIIGVGDRLHELERQETELYNRRHAIGQIADQKAKFAKEMPEFPDIPDKPISASALIRRQQDILAQNGENRRKRQRLEELEREADRIQTELEALMARRQLVQSDLTIARMDALELEDRSTEALERSIQDIETINRKVRANLDKEKAEHDAVEYQKEYDTMTAQIQTVRDAKMALLDHAALPLPGLSVQDGELTYLGKKWDNLSGSDQLKVSAAIVRAIKPQCGFVLLDKLEQLDLDTLREFGTWMEAEGLQGIATRVSTGGECSIIIEDGCIAGEALL